MTIFLLTHSTGIKGPGDFLEDYLLENGNSVLKLQHPLDNYRNKYRKNDPPIYCCSGIQQNSPCPANT